MAHTKGPWEIGKPLLSNTKQNTGIYANKGTPDEFLICEVQGINAESECGDNARLIIAAPELLEALEDLLMEIENAADYMATERAINAINKARRGE